MAAHVAASGAFFLFSLALCVPALWIYDKAVRISINHPFALMLAGVLSACAVIVYTVIHRGRFGGFDAAVRELDERYRMGFALRSYFEFEAKPSETEQRFRDGFAERMRGADFSPLRYWNEARRIARASVIAWGGIVLLSLIAFPFTVRTIVRYWQAMPFAVVAPGALTVESPPAVLRGEEARIAVTADAEEVIIALPKRVRASLVSNVWEYRVRPAADISFTVTAYKGHAVMRSTPRMLRAVDLPAVRTLSVSTASASGRSVSEDGNVEAVRGSWIQVEAEANNMLTNADVSVIDRGRTNRIRASVRGTHVSFGMVLRSEGEWFITLADIYGFTNTATPLYRLSLAADDAPYVEIREPRTDITVEVQKPVEIQYRAQDDHALRSVTLTAELFDGIKRMTNRTLTAAVLSNGGKSAIGVTMLDYRTLRPNPGYSISYYLSAVDSAGQLSRSDVRRIIFPSMADLFLAMNKKRTEAETSLASLAEDAAILKKNAEAMEREAKRERALGTRSESGEKAQALSHDVKEMRKKLDDIAAKVEKSVREAEVNKLLSPEVIGKLKDIRQSLNELSRETLAELDRNFSELIRTANSDRERTSAAAKMNAAEFEKRLDNLLAMLAELKDRERLSFLSREARDLASREKAIAAELASGMEYDAERMRREELIGDRVRALAAMIRENKAELSQERAAGAKDALSRSGLSGQDALGKKADTKAAKMRASAAGKSLDSLASSLESMLADMMEDAASRVRTVIDNALISMHRINELLARHKEWMDEASAGGRLSRIPAESRVIAKELAHYRGVTARIKADIVRELSRSVRGMDRLAVLFDEVLSGFDDFSRAVDNRFDPSQLKRSLDTIAGRQYALTYRLIRLRDSADSSSSQGEGMGSLSERQRSVNERTRSMFGKGGMERDMSGMGDYLSELAEEQRLIQNAMRAMSGGERSSEGKGSGGSESSGEGKGGKKFGGQEKGLGELSGMAEDMGKIEEEMKSLAKKFDVKAYEETLKRQSKLLERMLTYEKGLKRSNEEDRQYEAAGDTNSYTGSENDISAQTRIEQIKRIEEALRAKRYPEDHRREIEGYLEYLRRTR